MTSSPKAVLRTLPSLFVIDKRGKKMEWKTWAKGNASFHCFGYVDGKMREPIKREHEEVNEQLTKDGSVKKNYRSAEEQAFLFIKKSWAKQLDKNYKPAEDDKEGNQMYEHIMKNKDLQGGNNHLAKVQGGVSTLNLEKRVKSLTVSHVDTTILPMLAHKFLEKKDKYINFDKGVYIQPKLDGVRCIARIQKVCPQDVLRTYPQDVLRTYPSYQDGCETLLTSEASVVVLTSRTGKQFVHLKHIRNDILNLLLSHPSYQDGYVRSTSCGHTPEREIILDGELYIHENLKIKDKHSGLFRIAEYDERFSIITSACRTIRSSPHEYENQIQYHIFDIVDIKGKMEQKERFDILDHLFFSGHEVKSSHLPKEDGQRLQKKDVQFPSLQRVETFEINSEKSVYEYHDSFFKRGYEGIIIRDKKLTYNVGRRSAYLLKYKEFIDEECTIIGANQGNGTEEGAVIWICERDSKENTKVKFECRPRGTIEKRKEMYKNRDKYIGKNLTVRYQELSCDNIPRFPVGIEIRDYE